MGDFAAFQPASLGVAALARENFCAVARQLAMPARPSGLTDLETIQLGRARTNCAGLDEETKEKADGICLRLLATPESSTDIALFLAGGRYLSESGDRWGGGIVSTVNKESRSRVGERLLQKALAASSAAQIDEARFAVYWLYLSRKEREDWQGAYDFLLAGQSHTNHKNSTIDKQMQSAYLGCLSDFYWQVLRRPKLRQFLKTGSLPSNLQQATVSAFNRSGGTVINPLRPPAAAIIPLLKQSEIAPMLKGELSYVKNGHGVTASGITPNYSLVLNLTALLALHQSESKANNAADVLAFDLPGNIYLWPDALIDYLASSDDAKAKELALRSVEALAATNSDTTLKYMMMARNVGRLQANREDLMQQKEAGVNLARAWQIAMSHKAFPLSERRKVLVDYIDWLDKNGNGSEADNLRLILEAIREPA